MLEAAYRYRTVGIPVIPSPPRDKNPDPRALARTGNVDSRGRPSIAEFLRRLPTDGELEDWFQDDSMNLAIVTGYRQLFALDFDKAALYHAWQLHCPTLAARTSVQRTARGYHVLFRWAGAWSVPFYKSDRFYVMQHMDEFAGEMRGVGSRLHAWPSVGITGQQYMWLDGRAPWEVGVLRIQSLAEAGITPVTGLFSTYLRAALKLLRSPGEKLPLYRRWLSYHRLRHSGHYFGKRK